MEGLLDHSLRDALTRVGGVDRCVSEFIRVTGTLLPCRAFERVVPELRNGSRTAAGVPVRAQLLGSDAACLADNAARLAEMGSAGIDLNFGCPAKTVNLHRGGAVLLDEPETVAQIVSAVRRAVPAHVPVSAKMRLGFNDDNRAEECALAIEGAGATELVVHARTKAHGYRPPAYWERIADLRALVRLPLIANGEIWTVADALRCREVSGCVDLMIGRGMVSDPGLGLAIQAHDAGLASGLDAGLGSGLGGGLEEAAAGSQGAGRAAPWGTLLPLLLQFWHRVGLHVAARHRAGRLKQWLNYLRRSYPQAQQAFDDVRLLQDPAHIEQWLQEALQTQAQSKGC
jgi:tRNA-dihydrouridine synthase C